MSQNLFVFSDLALMTKIGSDYFAWSVSSATELPICPGINISFSEKEYPPLCPIYWTEC